MRPALQNWRHRQLVRASDWLAAAAGLLLAAAVVATEFYSTGYVTCTSTSSGAPVCQTVPMAQPIPLWAFIPLLSLVGLGLGFLLFRFRVRAVLIPFGLATFVFWVGTLGVSWEFLPAGFVSLVAGVL